MAWTPAACASLPAACLQRDQVSFLVEDVQSFSAFCSLVIQMSRRVVPGPCHNVLLSFLALRPPTYFFGRALIEDMSRCSHGRQWVQERAETPTQPIKANETTSVGLASHSQNSVIFPRLSTQG